MLVGAHGAEGGQDTPEDCANKVYRYYVAIILQSAVKNPRGDEVEHDAPQAS